MSKKWLDDIRSVIYTEKGLRVMKFEIIPIKPPIE